MLEVLCSRFYVGGFMLEVIVGGVCVVVAGRQQELA